MKITLKLEELAEFGLAIYLFNQTPYAWWVFLAWILAPDIGMIGYAFNTKTGAFTYNLTHHKGIAVVFLLCGWILSSDPVLLTGIIMFGHSAMDRIMGYGLKYTDDFKHTHLGWLPGGSNKG